MSDIRFADAREVEGWSRNLPEDYLLCRDLGHLWRPSRAHFVPADNVIERTMRCGRCKTERTQELSPTGHILSGRYDYAEDYLAPKGQGRLGTAARDSIRLESTLRVIGKDEGPEVVKRGA